MSEDCPILVNAIKRACRNLNREIPWEKEKEREIFLILKWRKIDFFSADGFNNPSAFLQKKAIL